MAIAAYGITKVDGASQMGFTSNHQLLRQYPGVYACEGEVRG
jgi:hypothetical protein